MISSKKFSILIAGFIWVIVAIRIGSRSLEWLSPYFDPPSWQLVFVLASIAIGILKGTKVLRKSVERSLLNKEKLDSSIKSYLFGWLSLYGKKGVIIVSLMIGLGFLLRYLKQIGFDPFNLFGFLYLAVAIGLGLGSFYYFAAAKELK